MNKDVTMSLSLRQQFVGIISDALREINEILGYEYFDSSKIEKNSSDFLKMLPVVETWIKSKRGVTLEDVEKEELNYEKIRAATILGIFDGIIIKDYKGTSFEEKFNDYLFSSGTGICKWIGKTGYSSYFQILMSQVSKLLANKAAIEYVNSYLQTNIKARSQAITTILISQEFFEDVSHVDERSIDKHIEIYKNLSAIAEEYFKLIYAIINNYWSVQNSPNLEKIKFHTVLKSVRENSDFKILTNAVPNTIYWNAAKHNKCFKNIDRKQITFKSIDGNNELNYSDFVSLVRELYACTLALIKINLMIRSHFLIPSSS